MAAGVVTVAAGAAAQRVPATRPLGPVIATARDSFGRVGSVRELSDGRVIVDDPVDHRLLLLDSALSHAVVIADTTGSTSRAYGGGGFTSSPVLRAGGLIAYIGDTTLFVDHTAVALLVIDPAGTIARVMAPPRPQDIGFVAGSKTAFDGHGHLVYPGQPPARLAGPGIPVEPQDSAIRDSQAIVRATMSSTRLDTAAFTRNQRNPSAVWTTASDGTRAGIQVADPLLLFDDWAMTSDGSIAILRAQNYHIDWVTPDGRVTATPPIAHSWIRLSDSAKTAIVDSVQHVRDSVRLAGRSLAGLVTQLVAPSALPDYFPPTPAVGLLADGDNRLWIPQAWLPAGGGTTYDIVDRAGQLVDRVQIPGATNIVGFGHGVVYLASRVSTRSVLVRARVR